MDIKNENLKLFLQTILNKPLTSITEKDLSSISTIALVGKIDNNSNLKINYCDLDLFPNLTEVIISNSYVSLNDLEIIKRYNGLKRICFDRCMFEKGRFPLSNSVSELELIGCYIQDYSFLLSINWLKKLVINNPYTENEINLSYLSNMLGLRSLVLDRCLLENFDNLSNLNRLEILSLLWDSLPDNYSDIFNGLPNLKKLYISEKYDSSFIKKSIDIKTNLNEFTYDYDLSSESIGRK